MEIRFMLFGKKRFNFLTMLNLYFKFAPAAAVYRTVMNIIAALTPPLSIIVTACFLDSAVAAVTDRSQLSEVYPPLILLVILSLYNYYVRILNDLVNTRMQNRFRKIIVPAITEKKSKFKFKYYENQESIDTMNRVDRNFEIKLTEFYDYVTNVFRSVVQIIGFLVILSAQLWWASVVFTVASIPSFIVAYIFGKKQYNNEKELTKIDRKVEYFGGLLTGRDTVEERYAYGYTHKLNVKYISDYENARISRNRLQVKWWVLRKLMSISTFMSGIAVIGILIPTAIFPDASGDVRLSIGMFTALAGAAVGVSSLVHRRITQYIKDLKYSIEYLKDLNNFVSFEEEENSDCLPDANAFVLKKIEFQNVNFKYPGAESYILKNLNLELYAGKHYAIVGINGAGKTTLAKILTRLYDNYEGKILINGKELRKYSQAEIKALASVVYQDFCRYPLNFYNNIAIGNVLDMKNKEQIENAVNIIGLNEAVEKLPQKYETPITKVKENGIDLSGGEWQRIALARLVVNPAPLKILDEPTAALDPISESRVYEQFSEIISHNQKSQSQGITIFISHRLGSTKLADEIVVISEGRAAEQGTFEQLMERGGLYAEMFESQAEWYRDDNGNTDKKGEIEIYA